MIPGLKYIADFVSEQEQNDLVQVIDTHPWDQSLTRRVQQYGYKYDYTKKTVDSSLYLGALPAWLSPYLQRLLAQKLFADMPDQVIINEYLPGQGISRHLDCVPVSKTPSLLLV
jgi:alkylated DNA repair dioxygenase AlkB